MVSIQDIVKLFPFGDLEPMAYYSPSAVGHGLKITSGRVSPYPLLYDHAIFGYDCPHEQWIFVKYHTGNQLDRFASSKSWVRVYTI